MSKPNEMIFGKSLLIDYKNHRGERSIRTIVPMHLWYGKTEWHKEEQWLVQAIDAKDGSTKDFALKDMIVR